MSKWQDCIELDYIDGCKEIRALTLIDDLEILIKKYGEDVKIRFDAGHNNISTEMLVE